MTKEQIITDVRSMSPADRRSIAIAIWPDIEHDWTLAGPPIAQDVFWAEIDRRIAAHEADPTRGVSWAELKARWAAGR